MNLILKIKNFFILWYLLIIASISIADPIQKPRYDDADELLKIIEPKNSNNARLFLRQQDHEIIFQARSPRNVTIDIVASIPEDADFGVIFFFGGTSVLSMKDGKLDRSFSFQSRSRDYWWAKKIATFLVDAPSDKLDKAGIEDARWRAGEEHQMDLKSVLDDISTRFSKPLVIHGHSNGALSVANAADLNHKSVKAYVYSSGSHYKRPTTIIYDVVHRMPVVFVQHKADTCAVSSTSAFSQVVDKVKAPRKYALLVEGGLSPITGPCGGFAPHSFFGIEKIVIDQQISLIRKAITE